MIEVDEQQFDEMVSEAIDTLPPEFGKMLTNVIVQVEDGDDPHLLGLYHGVPLPERSANFTGMVPDQISIYRLAICGICDTRDQVVEEVRKTVVHEIGHYFGIDDETLHAHGY